MLECAAEFGVIIIPYHVQVHRNPTNQGLGPISTQKTNPIGESYPTLYVMLPHHELLIWV
jgi:hypothetical protein